MIKRYLSLSSITVMAIGLVWSAWSQAVSADEQQPGGHLAIEQVIVDSDADTMAITGQHFDFNEIGDFVVTLGDGMGFSADITADCWLALPVSGTIVCHFSGGLPYAGDYLLTVASRTGRSHNDEYNLRIGDGRHGTYPDDS